MEDFKEFRDKEANKLRQIRKIDKIVAQDYFDKLQGTENYKIGKDQHLQKKKKSKNPEPEVISVEDKKELEQSLAESLESQLPAGFEIKKKEDGRIEIILQDQNSFDGWNSILPKIKDRVLNTIKLYDFEGRDDIYIEIKNPRIVQGQSEGESLGIKFEKKDIDRKDFDYLGKSDAVAMSQLFTIIPKDKLLICHKGMVRSISV